MSIADSKPLPRNITLTLLGALDQNNKIAGMVFDERLFTRELFDRIVSNSRGMRGELIAFLKAHGIEDPVQALESCLNGDALSINVGGREGNVCT